MSGRRISIPTLLRAAGKAETRFNKLKVRRWFRLFWQWRDVRLMVRPRAGYACAMIDRRAIPNVHWQMRLDRNKTGGAAIGDILVDGDDVEQAIGTIILTEKGSVPGQPEKCTRLAPYIDRRPDFAIPNITREIFDAITLWEPRIIVEQVKITREDFDHWRFPVFWRLRDDIARQIRQTIVLLPGERIPSGPTGGLTGGLQNAA